MKKILWFVSTLLMAVCLFFSAAGAGDRIFFGIATGGTGGTYYPLGGVLAQIISDKVVVDGNKLFATAETGNASVANAMLLSRNGIESAFVAADILDAAYKGTKQFDGKSLKNLRALGALYPETVQVVVRATAGVKTIFDLKGKSISSGSPGSGQWQLLGDLLGAYGMDRKTDIKEDYSSFAQSVEKIRDGDLDASLITAGTPTASVLELANHHNIMILPLSGAPIKALQAVQPYYSSIILPARTYTGQTEDVETIAVRAIWATHDKLDNTLAYNVVKALYENTDALSRWHVKGKEISLAKALESVSIPLHPGAEKYYREKGLIK
ncbi:TAXI family TRAP transporter solute-binding subunit [uncultured Desulfobacter sp.]|uniref:TAXI family TRAP transporter solute-binding subunit n=1 Tax=uncultured Desulfobacter sp. TaxID=240139 RepID=UPI002AAB84AF|nr:TAXI family TRAP transporter solute-binding subunit [uncultured Desulfobacter sp.]